MTNNQIRKEIDKTIKYIDKYRITFEIANAEGYLTLYINLWEENKHLESITIKDYNIEEKTEKQIDRYEKMLYDKVEKLSKFLVLLYDNVDTKAHYSS